jgi:hypothetical protein
MGSINEDAKYSMDIEALIARRKSDNHSVESLEGPFDYLVKWKNLSHLHVEWFSEQTLLDMQGTRMRSKIKKFNDKWEKRLNIEGMQKYSKPKKSDICEKSKLGIDARARQR